MTVEEALKILQSYPADAKIELSYYDFYGEKRNEPCFTYNPITETAFISPGQDLRYYDNIDEDEYEEEYGE